MPLLEWGSSLEVGVGQIDAQHKALCDIVNRLHDAMIDGLPDTTLCEIVLELQQYTVEHFGLEERYMAHYAYPGQAAHRTEHQDFVGKATQMESDCRRGKFSKSMDMLNYLSTWLVTHVLGTDKKLGQFLNARGLV
ncbi:bacteriohemerythrin [Solidesulfovibrio sp.]